MPTIMRVFPQSSSSSFLYADTGQKGAAMRCDANDAKLSRGAPAVDGADASTMSASRQHSSGLGGGAVALGAEQTFHSSFLTHRITALSIRCR